MRDGGEEREEGTGSGMTVIVCEGDRLFMLRNGSPPGETLDPVRPNGKCNGVLGSICKHRP